MDLKSHTKYLFVTTTALNASAHNTHHIEYCIPFSWDPKDPAVQEILAAGIFLPLPGFDRCSNSNTVAIQSSTFLIQNSNEETTTTLFLNRLSRVLKR